MAASDLSLSWVTYSHERGKKCCQGHRCLKAQARAQTPHTSCAQQEHLRYCLVTSNDHKMMPSKALQVLRMCENLGWEEIGGGKRRQGRNTGAKGDALFYNHISYTRDRHAHPYRIQRSIITGTGKMNSYFKQGSSTCTAECFCYLLQAIIMICFMV